MTDNPKPVYRYEPVAASDQATDAQPTPRTTPGISRLLEKISNRIAETEAVERSESASGTTDFAGVERAIERLTKNIESRNATSQAPSGKAGAPAGSEEPWSHEAADQLVAHCESAGLAGEPAAEPPVASALLAAQASPIAKAPLFVDDAKAHPSSDAVQYAYVQPSAREIGQKWFEDRFQELARRFDASALSAGQSTGQSPDTQSNAYTSIIAKLDGLEAQLAVLLGQPAADDEAPSGGALQDIELCIAEIANQLDSTTQELRRIEGLESQIAELANAVSGRADAAAAPGFDSFNPDTIADLIAQRMATQPAALAAVEMASGNHGASELSATLKQFIRDRQHDSEHTKAVFDSMQESIIRLLDRMDALEKKAPRAPLESPMHTTPTETRLKIPKDLTAASPAARRPAAQAEPITSSAPADALTSTDEMTIDHGSARGELGARSSQADAGRERIDDDRDTLDRLQRVVGELEDAEAEAHHRDPALPLAARSRADFIAAARRAAQKASTDNPQSATSTVQAERARMAAAARRNAEADQFNDDSDGEELEATRDGFSLGSLAARFRPKSKSKKRARAVVAILAIIAVGLGTTKFMMSLSSEAARQQLQSSAPAQSGSNSAAQAPRQQAHIESQGQTSGITSASSAQTAKPFDGRLPGQASSGTVDGTSTANGLVQQAAVNAGSDQPSLAEPVRGGRGRVAREELPSMLVGPLSMRLSAAQGDPSAEFEVASRFADGRGVQQDFDEAVKWYTRSAGRGFALAQYRLGTLYERGLGVTKDLARARIWYERAAANDNVKSMHNLAVLAASPTAGKPDYATAAAWFNKAAERGLADSQFNLAILHQNGLGVKQNLTQSYKWFALAAGSGDAEAVKRMTELASKLGKKQTATLDAEVRQWSKVQAGKLANDPHFAGQAWQRNS